MSRTFEGTVKWFNTEKGYGFIETDEIDEDLFVHFSEVNQDGFVDLEEGQTVKGRIERGGKGFKAVDVSVVKRRRR